MAKTYLESVKYMIHTKFEIDGIVDKPDIVGAVFGQSEGLLGEEMDLKELQKGGKVGRIEIDFKHVLGKTQGEILSPSSMDMVQTSLLAATFESVDKVGPCDAKFETTSIEDVRSVKRAEITKRAQEILSRFKADQPAIQEIESVVREESRASKVASYGRDKLPGGPSLASEQEIILVEGRADVINLLKNNIKNVLGIGGAKISLDVVRLCRGKEVTAFVDGDRGGELNLRKLMDIMRVDHVARAPDGKEVEELVGKEIVMALRKKGAAAEESRYPRQQREFGERPPFEDRETSVGYPHTAHSETEGFAGMAPPTDDRRPAFRSRPFGRRDGGFRERMPLGMRGDFRDRAPSGMREGSFREREPREFGGPRYERGSRFGPRRQPAAPRGFGMRAAPIGEYTPSIPRATTEEESTFRPVMDSLKQSPLRAKLLDKGMKEVAEVDVRDLVSTLSGHTDIHAVVFDGIITKRLAEVAEAQGVNYLVGVKRGRFPTGKTTKLVVLP